MNEMLAYCGLLCSECPAYQATVNDDEALRRNTANEWSVMFSANISADQINCLGCKSDTRFSHCDECEIRSCATGKELENCGQCSRFACHLLDQIFQFSPDARTRLEKAR